MSNLSSEMKFEIGQLVYHVTMQHDENYTPRPCVVVERIVQECHGGIQRFYVIASEFSDKQIKVAETELTAERPKFAWSDYWVAALRRPGDEQDGN